jgi:hypothetical protein
VTDPNIYLDRCTYSVDCDCGAWAAYRLAVGAVLRFYCAACMLERMMTIVGGAW